MTKYFIFLLPLWWLASCTEVKGDITPATASILIDSLPGSCPNLVKDQQGNIVLSWVRKVNDSTHIFCYATSIDSGQTFGAPVVITPSHTVKPHAENLPKLVFKPSGEIIAIWGTESSSTKNKYAGNLYYAQSFDGGKSWSNAMPLVKDTAGYDQRYFDVALRQDGEAAIIWLDNRKTVPQDGSALFFAATSGKEGFTGEQRIMQPTCQCCRTKLFIDSKNNIHAAFRGIIQDSVRDMMHTVSVDGGKTFSTPQRISTDNWVINACPHTGPAMTENGNGLQFSWYTGGKQQGTLHTVSNDEGNNFQPPQTITEKGKHPQMTAAPNGTIAIAWDENIKNDTGMVSRIGLKLMAKDGKTLYRGFVSPDRWSTTFPVVTMANEKRLVMAYTQKQEGKNFVAYQLVTVPE